MMQTASFKNALRRKDNAAHGILSLPDELLLFILNEHFTDAVHALGSFANSCSETARRCKDSIEQALFSEQAKFAAEGGKVGAGVFLVPEKFAGSSSVEMRMRVLRLLRQSAPTLTSLNVRNSFGFTECAPEHFLEPDLRSLLSEMHELESLSLNNMRTYGYFDCFAGLTKLKKLELQDVLPAWGSYKFAISIGSVAPSLLHLELSKNKDMRDSASAGVAAALCRFPLLRHLDLSQNGLGTQSAEALSLSLPSLSFLHHLDLSRNKLGSKRCADLIAAALPISLGYLDLSDNSLKKPGCLSIAKKLCRLFQLSHLNLSCNKFEAEAGLEMGRALSSLLNLRDLFLFRCYLNDEAGQKIVSNSLILPNLRHIDITHNDFGERTFGAYTVWQDNAGVLLKGTQLKL
jgi:hypothetical protein